MSNESYINHLQNVIEQYKQDATEILRHRFTDDEIKELCSRFVDADDNTNLQQQLEDEGHPQDVFFAVTSLCYLMYLENNVPPDDSCLVPSSFVANLVLVGFGAGMFLVEAGSKPSESFALTRLAQVLNQPNTRNHEQPEKQHIFEMLENYLIEKKDHPNNLGNFIRFLNNYHFVIDDENRTVDAPVGSEFIWKKTIAFGTIDNWRREYKKVHR